MFDPEIVRRDMERVFARSTRAGTLEEPSNVRVIKIGEAPAPSSPPAPQRPGGVRRAIALVCIALVVLPALAFGALHALDALKRSTPPKQAALPIAARSKSVPKAALAPQVKPPKNPAAFMVVAQDSVPQRAYRARRRLPLARYPTPFEDERETDAIMTRELNEDVLDQIRPVLGYSPGIGDRPPR